MAAQRDKMISRNEEIEDIKEKTWEIKRQKKRDK